MKQRKRAKLIRSVVNDLGLDISSSDDAMFIIGRLDAVASVVARYYKMPERDQATSFTSLKLAA